MKHSAQAFRIPQTLSEQSSKNFGIWQSKQIVLLSHTEVGQHYPKDAVKASPQISDREKGNMYIH